MIEVSLALMVLVVALVAMSGSTMRMHHLRRQNRERNVAMNALRTVSETIQAMSHQALANQNGWASMVNNQLAAGGPIGDSFPINELTPRAGEASVGTITVIRDETLSDADLGVELGMPRDLDGDGVVGNTNVGNAARILPIVVRARWHGSTGDVEIVRPFYVLGY